jgi:hypothetical protein
MQSQANNHETRNIMAKFETGKTYFTRSIGDHDCIHKFEILKRTDKSVWVKVHGEIVRRAIEIHGNTEAFYPFGKYSMAATITADRPLVEETEPESVANTAEAIREKRRAAIAEKTEARLERYEELADKNARASTAAYERSTQMASVIPMGQPILVGHHSERRDRDYRDKIWNTMGQSVKLQEKADYYQEKAQAMTNNHAISSDDPDAIEKLQAKLDGLMQNQEQMKKANAAIRKLAKQEMSHDDRAAKVAEMSGISLAIAKEVLTPDWIGRIGYPSFKLSNNNAVIRSTQQRLEMLKAQWATVEAVGEDRTIEHADLGVTEVHNYVINRIQLKFPGKPETSTRDILKGRGFRWSPREGAWQRQLNANGIAAAQDVISQLSNL